MYRLIKLLCCLLLGCWSLLAAVPHTTVRLHFEAAEARPGDTVWLGVQLSMEKGWHTYWAHGGDAGLPTRITWELPPGFSAGAVQWPVPEKLVSEGLVTFVYSDEVVLLAPLTVGASVTAGVYTVSAKVKWLECDQACVPGAGTITGSLEVGGQARGSASAGLIQQWQQRLPQPRLPAGATLSWQPTPLAEERDLLVEWPARVSALDFYPLANDPLEVAGKSEVTAGTTDKMVLRKRVKRTGTDWPPLTGVVSTQLPGQPKAGYAVDYDWGASATKAPTGTGAANLTLWMALLLGFVGGIILNGMPCVLPIVSLKILGFVHQAAAAPGRVRKLGLVYGAGVLCSFWALAGLIIAVSSTGRQAGWGMQFQNPVFIVGLATLVTLVALNLFGLFEITLGSGTLTRASDLAAQEGCPGAFFNGVLAVVLATPCTAPFLGAALGYALVQPPLVILLVFTMIALGLALPYVLLSWFPAWLRFLPRPGAWMDLFRKAMGFPMLATAVWLFSVAIDHFGKAVVWFGLFLVITALAAWIFGEFCQRGSRRPGLARLLALALWVGFGGYALEYELHWRNPARARVSGIAWQPWSSAAVEKARAGGRVVLVDFTADWCLTCQANKRTSIEIPSVRQKLEALSAVALLGDYTLRDDQIAAELRLHNRAGVPLVLVYPRNRELPPLVLPELLTPQILLDALDKASK